MVVRSIPLAYSTLLFVLALFKATKLWKENGVEGSRLIMVLIKDQAIYFAV